MQDLFEYYRLRIEALEKNNEQLRFKIEQLRSELRQANLKNNRN